VLKINDRTPPQEKETALHGGFCIFVIKDGVDSEIIIVQIIFNLHHE